MDELFSSEEISGIKTSLMPVMPVSVIDIGSGVGQRDEPVDHSKSSSRAKYSPFPHEVCNLVYSLFLRNATHVFDPFAGWGERHAYANRYNIRYTGYDLSSEAIAHARNMFGVENRQLNSLENTSPISSDALFTCPPYWNLESYNGNGIDKAHTWNEFLCQYREVFKCARVGRFNVVCIMVGNWRKGGVYYDLQHETDKIMREAGLVVFDKVVVSRKKISKIKVMLPQAKRLGYTVNVHEHLLVYKRKGLL